MNLTNPLASWISKINNPARLRQWLPGFLFVLVGIFIKLVLNKAVDASALTTFTTNINKTSIQIPNFVFNTKFGLDIIAGLCAGIGIYQIVRGFKKRLTMIIAVIGILVVLGFLVWGASSSSLSFTGMLAVMVIRAVPITIGALAGILCERAGIFNIAIEGMMIAGAFAGAVVGSIFNLWAGILAAIAPSRRCSSARAITWSASRTRRQSGWRGSWGTQWGAARSRSIIFSCNARPPAASSPARLGV